MNKKLENLAANAGFYVHTSDGRNIINTPFTTDDLTILLEKFSELIVKDCYNIAERGKPSDILNSFGVEWVR